MKPNGGTRVVFRPTIRSGREGPQQQPDARLTQAEGFVLLGPYDAATVLQRVRKSGSRFPSNRATGKDLRADLEVRPFRPDLIPSKTRRSLPVLLVAHLFHPVDRFPVKRFRDGDVRHSRGRDGSMPMFDARRNSHHIAGLYFLNRTVPMLDQPRSSP
jgi:hypothetical protein